MAPLLRHSATGKNIQRTTGASRLGRRCAKRQSDGIPAHGHRKHGEHYKDSMIAFLLMCQVPSVTSRSRDAVPQRGGAAVPKSTQSHSMARTLGSDPVPEPVSLAMFGVGLAGLP